MCRHNYVFIEQRWIKEKEEENKAKQQIISTHLKYLFFYCSKCLNLVYKEGRFNEIKNDDV